jgi:hypothetical protein
MADDLILNASPVLVAPGGHTQAKVATQGYNVVTIAPIENFDVDYRIDYGSSNVPGIAPRGAPIPWPICQDWNNSKIVVNNINAQQGNANVGLYGFNNQPTQPLPGTQNIGQYQSAGGQTTTSNMTLSLRHDGPNAVIVFVIVGSAAPEAYALNTSKDNLPPQYKDLKNFVAVDGPTKQITKNFWGQYVFVINASLVDVPVEVRLT